MKNYRQAVCLLVVTLLHGSFGPFLCDGFEIRTHETISLNATQSSQLNNYLTTVLPFDFPGGISESLSGKRVDRLIQDGSMNEDSPFTRTRAHFHDPTRAWAQAGLGHIFESSVLWSQNPNQILGGKHSWKDARDSYFKALTSTSAADRKKYYAETFETLGHLIHHVQDAATPAHTRNDAHIGFFIGNGYGFPVGNPDRFHHWANTVGANQVGGNLRFDPTILDQTYNGLAPIAGIIDTTTAAGLTVPSAATNIGIAEFSNANFFSDDTILKDYAYPDATQFTLTQEPGPSGPALRSYLRKTSGPGPTGYRAAVGSRLFGFLPFGFPTQQWELDDNVMADYGTLLFPRAIGYSAGLIDYFFRNGLTGYVWGPYNCTQLFNGFFDPSVVSSYEMLHVPVEAFDGITWPWVLNEQAGTGRIVVIFRYIRGGQTHYYKLSDSVTAFQTIDLSIWQGYDPSLQSVSGVGSDYSFLQASDILLPPIFVYRGPLGQDPDAIVAGFAGYINAPDC